MKKGTTHSQETKDKIAQAKLNKKFAPEHSAAIALALKGKVKTEEHKQAIRDGIKAARLLRLEKEAALNEVLLKQVPLESNEIK